MAFALVAPTQTLRSRPPSTPRAPPTREEDEREGGGGIGVGADWLSREAGGG
jgi:hypothetical protein